MRAKITIFLVLVIILCVDSFAEKRYVSRDGTSTPPYTSWETAADSIMKAMSISLPGDTIIVGQGVFTEAVIFNSGITLIGMGWESTIIMLPSNATVAVVLANQCEIKSLKVEGKGFETFNKGIYAYRDYGQSLNVKINNVKTTNFYSAVYFSGYYNLYADTSYLFNNIIDSCVVGIYNSLNNLVIYNNFVTGIKNALYMHLGSFCIVHDNVLVSAQYIPSYFATIREGFSNPAKIYNNIIMSLYETNINIYTSGAEIGPDTLRNNLFIGNFGITVNTSGTSSFRDIFNNHISGGGYYGFYGESPLRFNNFWKNGINYRTNNGSVVDSISNISRFPMFLNQASDYHLQAFSPLINAGDTLVKDKDGSRSDIGLYGGPFGTSYTYLDIAPLEPRGIIAEVSGDTVKMNWNRNHETDFHHYLVYGDSIQGFSADSTHSIGTTSDTTFTKVIHGFSGSYFITLRSEDNQGNISDASEEIRIVPVGIKVEGHDVAIDYRLFQNYPNPYNSSTVIGFRIKEEGRVLLVVYTLTGEKVSILRDETIPAGYYESHFEGEGLSSGIYLYKLDVISSDRVPVYTEIKKMILLK